MPRITRRSFNATALSAWVFGPAAWAGTDDSALPRTPAQTEGPFYPLAKPANPGNNLVRTGPGARVARGDLLRLSGRVIDPRRTPVIGATVEIWQVDHQGHYKHPRARGNERFDRDFQGYGESVTDAEGRYAFMTIVPASYPGRPPHIHVKVKANGEERLTTQLYLKGHPDNARDGIPLRLLGLGGQVELFIDPVADGAYAGRALQRAGFDFVV